MQQLSAGACMLAAAPKALQLARRQAGAFSASQCQAGCCASAPGWCPSRPKSIESFKSDLCALPGQADYSSVGAPVWPTEFIPMKTPMSREILDNWSLPGPPKHPLTVCSRQGRRKQLQRTTAAQRDSALPNLSPAGHEGSASAPRFLRAHPSPAALRCAAGAAAAGGAGGAGAHRGAHHRPGQPRLPVSWLLMTVWLLWAGWLLLPVPAFKHPPDAAAPPLLLDAPAACAGTPASLPACAARWMQVAAALLLLLPAGASMSPPSHCISSHTCSYSDDVPDSIEYEHVQLIAKVRRQQSQSRGRAAQHATTAC